MGNYNFTEDILIGEEGEDFVIKYLESEGAKLISKNKNNSHDTILEFKNELISYEIKTDVYCNPKKDTGNIFVEYECRGEPSGIEVSKAKWFVYYFKFLNEIWFIKTQDLKKLIQENNFKKTNNSGDKGSNTCGYLIKRQKFIKNFIVKKINPNIS
jgi:hypothetical protein